MLAGTSHGDWRREVSGIVTKRWMVSALRALAQRGWSGRRPPPTQEFLLRATDLPIPSDAEDMDEAVRRLCQHARVWAPGFVVREDGLRVTVSPDARAGATYDVSSVESPRITIDRRFTGQPAPLYADLAHELCHHILYFSGLASTRVEETEALEDLMAFVCGYGALMLAGCRETLRAARYRFALESGYLTVGQCRYAHRWVLCAQRLPRLPVRVPALPSVFSMFWHELSYGLWTLGTARASDPTGAWTGAGQEPAARAAQLREEARWMLRDSPVPLEWFIRYERQWHPHADEATLLAIVIRSLRGGRHQT